MSSTVCRLLFSYEILSPAALNFFVSYAEGAVESLWSIDQYFEFILVLMLSTGLAFQVFPHVALDRPFFTALRASNVSAIRCILSQGCFKNYSCLQMFGV